MNAPIDVSALHIVLFTWVVLTADEHEGPLVRARLAADDVCASHFSGFVPHSSSEVACHKPFCMVFNAALGAQNTGARITNPPVSE